MEGCSGLGFARLRELKGPRAFKRVRFEFYNSILRKGRRLLSGCCISWDEVTGGDWMVSASVKGQGQNVSHDPSALDGERRIRSRNSFKAELFAAPRDLNKALGFGRMKERGKACGRQHDLRMVILAGLPDQSWEAFSKV